MQPDNYSHSLFTFVQELTSMSTFGLFVIITAPCSILQKYSVLHLDGQDFPQVRKTYIITKGINTDIVTGLLETIICLTVDIIPHKD